MSVPVRFTSSPEPWFAKRNKPVFQVRRISTPYTVPSLGMNQKRYYLSNNSDPDFDSLTNLTLLDSGVTPIVGFYAGGGAPIGLSIVDSIAIRYNGFFNSKHNIEAEDLFLKAAGFGNMRIRLDDVWVMGNDTTFIALNQHNYANSTPHTFTPSEWIPIQIDYFVRTGEAGFCLLWRDDFEEIWLPVSAGVTNTFPGFIDPVTIDDVIDISTLSANRLVGSFSFDIPLVQSSDDKGGYYYDKDLDHYINVDDSTKSVKKYDMIEVFAGYKENNRVLKINGQGQYLKRQGSFADSLNLGSSDVMVEAWIKHDTATGQLRTICRKIEAATDGGYLFRLRATGEVEFEIFQPTTGTRARVRSIETVDDNSWHHVAVLLDASEANGLKIYIDTVEATYSTQEDPSSIGDIDNTNDFEVGSDGGSSENYNGLLDNLRIWNFGVGGLPSDIEEIISHHFYFPFTISALADETKLKGNWEFQEDNPALT